MSQLFYDKEGRVPRGLQYVYEKQRLQRSTGCLKIQEFFESYAVLGKDLMQAYNWCFNVLTKIRGDGWEGEVCDLFEETYPSYPQEPLHLLIQSGVFILCDGYENKAMFSAVKICYFILLASKADYKDKLECWYKHEYENQKEKTIS